MSIPSGVWPSSPARYCQGAKALSDPPDQDAAFTDVGRERGRPAPHRPPHPMCRNPPREAVRWQDRRSRRAAARSVCLKSCSRVSPLAHDALLQPGDAPCPNGRTSGAAGQRGGVRSVSRPAAAVTLPGSGASGRHPLWRTRPAAGMSAPTRPVQTSRSMSRSLYFAGSSTGRSTPAFTCSPKSCEQAFGDRGTASSAQAG